MSTIVTKSFYLFLYFLGSILLFTAFHNIDLLSNYALLLNDFNSMTFNSPEFMNLRNISDCAHLNYCPYYKEMYMLSIGLLFLSFACFSTVIILQMMKNED